MELEHGGPDDQVLRRIAARLRAHAADLERIADGVQNEQERPRGARVEEGAPGGARPTPPPTPAGGVALPLSSPAHRIADTGKVGGLTTAEQRAIDATRPPDCVTCGAAWKWQPVTEDTTKIWAWSHLCPTRGYAYDVAASRRTRERIRDEQLNLSERERAVADQLRGAPFDDVYPVIAEGTIEPPGTAFARAAQRESEGRAADSRADFAREFYVNRNAPGDDVLCAACGVRRAAHEGSNHWFTEKLWQPNPSAPSWMDPDSPVLGMKPGPIELGPPAIPDPTDEQLREIAGGVYVDGVWGMLRKAWRHGLPPTREHERWAQAEEDRAQDPSRLERWTHGAATGHVHEHIGRPIHDHGEGEPA